MNGMILNFLFFEVVVSPKKEGKRCQKKTNKHTFDESVF